VSDELPADLLRTPAVLVRRDGHMPPLEPLYNGPYHMLARSRDWFHIQVGTSLDPSALPAEPRHRGRLPGPPKGVTFHWPPPMELPPLEPPPLEPSPTRLAVPVASPPPLHLPGLMPELAAVRTPSPPGLGPGTVFSPQHQGFFVRPGPSQAQRPATQTGQPQPDGQPLVRLDL
jgi:hypothetical protein